MGKFQTRQAVVAGKAGKPRHRNAGHGLDMRCIRHGKAGQRAARHDDKPAHAAVRRQNIRACAEQTHADTLQKKKFLFSTSFSYVLLRLTSTDSGSYSAPSVQGGREGVSYYISGRYYNQDGIYKVGEETYKKYNLRAKGSIRIRPWLTLDNNTSLMSSKYHQPMVHYGQQVISRQIDMFAFPFALLKNPDGTWTQTAAKTGYAAFAEGTSWQENNKLEVANTTTFNFEFVPDVFKVSADVTYKGSRWSRDRMENLYTYYTGVNVSGQDNSFSSLENWTYRSDYISTNIVGTVTPKLGADHDLNVVAGWNLEDYDYRTQKTYRQGNLYPSKPSFTLMDGESLPDHLGRLHVGPGRILRPRQLRLCRPLPGRSAAPVTTGRRNSRPVRSGASSPRHRSDGASPKSRGSNRNVEGWLDNFKVRASIGSLGNANIDPYQYLETMTASGSASIAKSSVIINGQNVPYTSVPSLIPDDIAWEKVTTYNIGLDLDLFHNRLSFTGDYYRRNTTDLYTVGPNLPAGTRKRRALRQLRQPQDQGMGAEPFVARLVQPGRQAVQLQHQGYAVGQPQLDHRRR